MKNKQTHFISEIPDAHGDHIFIKKGRQIAHLDGKDYDLGKLVFSTFDPEERHLDPTDASWIVEHIDGDATNNAITNLRYVKL